MPPCEIVPALADEGTYIASESTFYRILREEKMQNHWGRAQEPGTTGTDGILFLGKLSRGEYRLLETKAPDGFILPETAIKVIVADDTVTVMQGSGYSYAVSKGDEDWVDGQTDDTKQIQVWNNPGVELPNTGGSGTRSFTILGSLMIFGAGILLWRRQRLI